MENLGSLIPLTTTLRPWSKGKLIGPKPPLRSKHVRSIRTKLRIDGRKRDLALFKLAIDSEHRGCDVVAIRVEDVAPNGDAVDQATSGRRRQAAQCALKLQNRQGRRRRLRESENRQRGDFLFRGRNGSNNCLTTRQHARLVSNWVPSCGLDPSLFGTLSPRRIKATMIHQRTGNLRADQRLPGQTKIESTFRCFGIEIDDALDLTGIAGTHPQVFYSIKMSTSIQTGPLTAVVAQISVD